MAKRSGTVSSRNLNAGTGGGGSKLSGIMKPLANLLIPTKGSRRRASVGGSTRGPAKRRASGSTSRKPKQPPRWQKAAGNSDPSYLNKPGKYAGESIPARSSSQSFNKSERADMNRIGSSTGCHSCGTTSSGRASGNFTPDHQPPSALNVGRKPQRLYPHCQQCSSSQGAHVRNQLSKLTRKRAK